MLEKLRGQNKGKKKISGAFVFYLVPRNRFVLVGAWKGIFAFAFGLDPTVLAVSVRGISC